MPPLTPAALCSSHHSIILSYARAACSSWSKQPREVGLPLRRNWASQRRVGKVWCTPRYFEVKVRPPDFLAALVTLPTWRTPPAPDPPLPPLPCWRWWWSDGWGIAAAATAAAMAAAEAGGMGGSICMPPPWPLPPVAIMGSGREPPAAASAADGVSVTAGVACEVGTKVEGCRPAAGYACSRSNSFLLRSSSQSATCRRGGARQGEPDRHRQAHCWLPLWI